MNVGASEEDRRCRYSLRRCSKAALASFQYCKTHILEDKNSPYQQCSYVSSKTGRRCVLAALKTQKKESLCSSHIAKINRNRCSAARKHMDTQHETAETMLESLEHYSSTLFNNNRADKKCWRNEGVNTYLAELASSSESDVEDRNYINSTYYMPDSDSESIDSENEDIFKYADVLTEEEATRITRDKLIRLQSLYIDQFKWLNHVLRERRRKYLADRKLELESAHTDAVSSSDDAEELSKSVSQIRVPLGGDSISQQYLAMRRYHKKHGVEAIMYMKSQERRKAVGDAATAEPPVYNRYRHSTRHGTKYCSVKSIKCNDRALPFTRYCTKHIEHDGHQVLFRRCGFVAVDSGLACERIVPNFNTSNRCSYHVNNSDLEAHQLHMNTVSQDSTNDVEVVDEQLPDEAARQEELMEVTASGEDINGTAKEQSESPLTNPDVDSEQGRDGIVNATV